MRKIFTPEFRRRILHERLPMRIVFACLAAVFLIFAAAIVRGSAEPD